MPIVVTCPCGKRIKFPDHAAGKRAKCPACGEILTAPGTPPPEAPPPEAPPPEVPEPAVEDTYELLDAPPEALQPVARPVATATPPDGDDGPRARPALSSRLDVNSPFYRAASGRVAARDAAAEKGGRPLFNAFGVDVTRGKLAAVVVLLLIVAALPTWFFTVGPGVDARILSAQTVQVVPLLQGLDSQEPYSLFTGTGNRALGVQGPKLRNAPMSASATVALQYTVGGGEELLLTRPDPQGDQVLVQASISHALIQHVQRLSQYKIHINANDFALVPEGAGGGAPGGSGGASGGGASEGRLLFAAFEEGIELDLNGPNAIGHEPLMPAGVTPSKATLERGRNGGSSSGTLRYDNVNGVSGEFRFTSTYYLTGAPGARGVSADGHVTRFTPDGAEVEYDYNGGTLELTWDKAPHRAGWWSKGGFKDDESFNPWAKVRVALLFDRPPGIAPAPGTSPGPTAMRLTYCGEPVGTVYLAKAVRAAEKAARETDEKANRPSAFASGPQDPLTGYLKVIADARQKARGVVAMSNMNQLGLAIGMYAEQHGGRLPESLYDLRSVMPEVDSILVNLRTGEKPGFIYERPAEHLGQVKDPARTPMLWESEKGQKMQGGSVLYADGHIESPLIP